MKNNRKALSLTILISSFFICSIVSFNNASASGWIGEGSGGTAGSGYGYEQSGWVDCNYSTNWMYIVDCAGISWAYYKASSTTTSDTYFPYLNKSPESDLNVKNSDGKPEAKIPAECSGNATNDKGHEYGFWHLGINSFGVYIGNYGGGTNNMLYTGGWYGHYLTLNAGHYTVSWAPYNTANLSGKTRQTVGVYQLERYGDWDDALEAYQQAWAEKNNKDVSEAPDSIPDDVWGFCWSDAYEDEPDNFKGKATVTNAAKTSSSKNTGYVNINKSAGTLNLPECSGNNNCYKATFKFEIKRTTDGDNQTEYKIQERKKNSAGKWVWEDLSGYTNWQSTSIDTGQNKTKVVKTITTSKLNAGDSKVCYRMRFRLTSEDNAKIRNTTACAQVPKVKLKAYAKDYDTEELLNDQKAISSDEGIYGSNLSVTSENFNPSAYTWKEWDSAECTNTSSRTCTINNLIENKVVYAYYIKNSYLGRSRATAASSSTSWSDISNGLKKDTGWKNDNNTSNKVIQIAACDDSINGCDVSLRHLLQQDVGSSSTKYKITQSANFSVPNELKPSTTESTEDFTASGVRTTNSGIKYRTVRNQNFKLKPGQIICETLHFMPNNLSGTTISDASTTACIVATGTVGSTIDIKAGKTATNLLDAPESDPIYAKPTDTIYLKGTYTPTVQYAYNYKPKQITGALNVNNNSDPLQIAFNKKISPGWNNAFSIKISSTPRSTTFIETKKNNSIGNSNTYYSNDNLTHTINFDNDPGNTITATATTNSSTMDSTKTTPKQITFSYNTDTNFTADVNNDPISDNSYIKVPYNFNNSTCIQGSNSDTTDSNGCVTSATEKIVYAGETSTISYNLMVGTRQNNTVGGDPYATIVRDAQWKIVICINGYTDCYEDSDKGNLNSAINGGSLAGKIEKKQTSINIPDRPAGTKLYVKSMLYPASSDNDTNLDPKGSDTWTESGWVEFTIVKRPSLKVLGGNIYSAGNITTGVSKKNNLAGITDYDIKNKQGNYLFGSWGELGIISTGTIKGLASGASLSTEPNNSIIRSGITIVCPLSFANNNCNNGNIMSGAIGNSSALVKASGDKESILKTYDTDEVAHLNDGASISLAPNTGSIQNGKYYYLGSGNLTINDSNINKNNAFIVKAAEHTVTINGNISFVDDYQSFDDMPKVIIYAKDIIIACHVKNIDGVLIAENTIKTCDSDNVDSIANANPLKINGAVIASELIPNRTYGAATGANSGVPAETINFNPSLYRWQSETVEGSTNIKTNLEVTKTRELAPRL